MRILIYTHPLCEVKSKSLARVLKQCGIHADITQNRDHFLYVGTTEKYVAVLFHAPLPVPQLKELVQLWKKVNSRALVIVLSPTQSALLRGQALEGGVDRYYIEPYSYTNLVKEISLHDQVGLQDYTPTQTTQCFEIDILRRNITYLGADLILTRTEFDILSLLLRRKGAVLSRVQIWEEIWGYENYPLANTIDVHINRLRKKLPDQARRLVSTVYGVGYRAHAEA